MGSDSDGALQPKEEYAKVIASTNHLEILCFVTGPPLARLLKPTKSCSDFLYEAERSMYIFRALTGQSRASWLPVGGGVGALALWPGLWTEWFQDDLGVDLGKGLQVSYLLDRRQCSNGGPIRALSTVDKSQGGTVWGRGGIILLAPRKNVITALSLPTDRPAIGAWKVAMAAV